MPNITSSKIFRPGEEPIFLAYVYHNGPGGAVPFTRSEIKSIFASHQIYKIGIKGGLAVRSWFPVEYNGILFDQREISPKVFLDTVVVQSGTAAFDHTSGRIFDYNFVYIPVHAPLYFRVVGNYRTIITVTLNDGRAEVITFESKCQEQDVEGVALAGSTPAWGNPQSTIETQFGEDIPLVGRIYTKVREDDGRIVYPAKDNDFVSDVFLTIWTRNNEEHMPRTSITKEVVLESIDAAPLDHNVRYTLPKQYLRTTGGFSLKFEIMGINNELKCQWITYINVT